ERQERRPNGTRVQLLTGDARHGAAVETLMGCSAEGLGHVDGPSSLASWRARGRPFFI
ncbi:hypothetical protein M885DRAFT_516054, partial [Pelagophyceae sp. CCMP2097]